MTVDATVVQKAEIVAITIVIDNNISLHLQI